MTEKRNKCKKIQKPRKSFNIFEKVTLIHANITCVKVLKYALHYVKCTSSCLISSDYFESFCLYFNFHTFVFVHFLYAKLIF